MGVSCFPIYVLRFKHWLCYSNGWGGGENCDFLISGEFFLKYLWRQNIRASINTKRGNSQPLPGTGYNGSAVPLFSVAHACDRSNCARITCVILRGNLLIYYVLDSYTFYSWTYFCSLLSFFKMINSLSLFSVQLISL